MLLVTTLCLLNHPGAPRLILVNYVDLGGFIFGHLALICELLGILEICSFSLLFGMDSLRFWSSQNSSIQKLSQALLLVRIELLSRDKIHCMLKTLLEVLSFSLVY